MPRYKLTIEYDGRRFAGWQRQANALSVQQVLETAFQGFCGEAPVVHAAGRTDAGVHARGQVAHITLERTLRPDKIREAVNAYLRLQPVAVLQVEIVSDTFEARFDALQRHYLYRIINRRAPLTLETGQAWLVKRRLDADAMQDAAQRLLGSSGRMGGASKAVGGGPRPAAARRRVRPCRRFSGLASRPAFRMARRCGCSARSSPRLV